MSLNTNNMNKEQTQKKILLATALSFAFFIAYDFFYLQPKQVAANELNKQNKVVQQQTTMTKNQAPATINQTVKSHKSAPTTKNVVATNIITTVETKNNIIQIDNLGRIAQVALKQSRYVDADKKHIHLFNQDQLRPLEVRFTPQA